MEQAKSNLPDFASPPVIEVAVSLTFSALRALRVAQLGLLWSEYRDRYPVVEEHPPLPPSLERFGTVANKNVGLQIEFTALHPVPRVWFMNQAGTELVQVQQDRFVYNWRKAGDEDDYPRFESVVARFQREVEVLRSFLAKEQIGDLDPLQCELTYVNRIPVEGTGQTPRDAFEVLRIVQPLRDAKFLPAPEDLRIGVRYLMRDESNEPVGRLLIESDPAYGISDNESMNLLKLTALLRPDGPWPEGILRSLERGRTWIVRGFADITTASMHTEWGRRQ